MSFDPAALPLWITLVVFGAAAAIVWVSGSRLARYATELAERTGMGKAFMGLVLLGGVTSLPEGAVSVTAGMDGDAALAVNNLLGGVAMQVAILAAADLLVRRSLTAIIVQPAVILQGAFGVLMLAVVAGAIAIGEIAFLGVGLASLALVVLCGTGVWMAKLDENLPGWTAVNRTQPSSPRSPAGAAESDRGLRTQERQAPRDQLERMTSLVWRTGVAAVAVLIAGVVLARAGESIAERTQLGSDFVGAALVATSTSLPEVSTVLAAVRLGQYSMAFSDIFGTNLFDIALIFVVDASYQGQAVLSEVHEFSLLAALLGATVTLVYMIGLIERRDGALPRIGYDSLAVAVLYVSGLALLYQLR